MENESGRVTACLQQLCAPVIPHYTSVRVLRRRSEGAPASLQENCVKCARRLELR